MIWSMSGAKPSEAPRAGPGLHGAFTLVQRSQARPWDDCIVALYGFLYLEDDWNGDGAQAPQVANVYRAIALVQHLRADPQFQAPQAVPGVNGEVLLAWVMGPTYVEAEISNPDRVDWMLTSPGQPARHWVTPCPRDLAALPGRQKTAATLPVNLSENRAARGQATSGATLVAEPAA